MTTPYSLDLRKRVVGFVEAGHSRHASAAHFGGRFRFVKLTKNYQQTGSRRPSRVVVDVIPNSTRIARFCWLS